MTTKTTRAASTAATTAKGRKRKSATGRTRNVRGTDSGRFAKVLKDVLVTVPESDRDGFVTSVVGSEDELDTALWGREPSVAERRTASLENLRLEFEARRTVLEESLTRAEVAELLDVSEQAVLDRLESGALVGLKKGREWRLPTWQFNPDAERGFVPGLAELQQVFPGGVVTLSSWVSAPSVDLDGATPAAELAAGHVDRVVLAAKSLTAAAW